ncbi:hypothetical protein NDR87_31550 [Nocardia sp. CDC159]|uniref:Uncharacterized protein n=1 Tax=Nocardia pulmonis TaxID=2951408 RepID=A0A9X2EBL0_9NOCA|nr:MULTISPECIES: hypothetical protein [Nocardia]MCM6777914.1 hypothetical protein [Nocardia pulmonis]MCM6790915.1 hypothetical protein [Nocardia sp. CDC159]
MTTFTRRNPCGTPTRACGVCARCRHWYRFFASVASILMIEGAVSVGLVPLFAWMLEPRLATRTESVFMLVLSAVAAALGCVYARRLSRIYAPPDSK